MPKKQKNPISKLGKRRRAELSVIEQVDVSLVEQLAPIIESPSGRAVGKLGNLGDQLPLLALASAVLAAGWWRKDKRLKGAGGAMIVAHLFATMIKDQGKERIRRSRPDALLRDRRYMWKAGGSADQELQSFPSGHTAGAFAMAGAAARAYPAHTGWFFGAAGIMGALQVLRQAHFPFDVLAGAFIGIASHRVSAALLRQATRRPELGEFA